MSNVINFRQARKAKARADKARQADANRAKFGRAKAEKMADVQNKLRNDKMVDGARLIKEGDRDVSSDD